MVKLRVIALNALQETLRRKVLYIVVFLTVIVLALTASQMVFLHMATAAGENKIAASVALKTVQAMLGIWSAAAFFLALFSARSASLRKFRRKRSCTSSLVRSNAGSICSAVGSGCSFFSGGFS